MIDEELTGLGARSMVGTRTPIMASVWIAPCAPPAALVMTAVPPPKTEK
jgi:hypothetical protein